MIITTEAIILHSRKYSDTSKILVAFTRDEGKVSLIAKGARNPKSKFGGCLEPLSFSSLTIYKKANKELHTLGKAEIITPLRRLTADYDKLTTALSIAEAVNLTQINETPHRELFDTVYAVLHALNDAEHNNFSHIVWFQLRLAALMGFMVEMEEFVDNGAPIIAEPDEEYIVSIANGGVLSAETSRYAAGYRLTAQELRILSNLWAADVSMVHTIALQDNEKARLTDFMTQYFSFHLDKRLHYKSRHLHTDNVLTSLSATP